MRKFDVAAEAGEIECRLGELGTPQRADSERRYLRSTLTHLGVRVPEVRRTVKAVRRSHPGLARDELTALADALWRRPVHECRLAAVELLRAYQAVLEPPDLAYVERRLRTCRTWALLDPLAINVAGALVVRCPELGATLDRWAADADFWIRRAALLALLPGVRNGGPDLRRFERYADAMLEEREFYIRKAIGWVLREVSRERPDHVRDWVAARTHRISGVTIREAVRHLPEADRDRLLAAYRSRPSTVTGLP